MNPPIFSMSPHTTRSRTWPSESRQYPRRRYSGTIYLHPGGSEEFQALDISTGGIGVLGSRSIGIGVPVNVALLGKSVAVDGIVRFERETDPFRWHLGIQFLEPQPELAEVAARTT